MIVLFLLSAYATLKVAYQTDDGLLYLGEDLKFSKSGNPIKIKRVNILQQNEGRVILVGGDNRLLETWDGNLQRTEFIDSAHKVTNLTKLSAVTLDPKEIEKVGFTLALEGANGEYKILAANGQCLAVNENRKLESATGEQCSLDNSYFRLIFLNEDIPLAPKKDEGKESTGTKAQTNKKSEEQSRVTSKKEDVPMNASVGDSSTHIVRRDESDNEKAKESEHAVEPRRKSSGHEDDSEEVQEPEHAAKPRKKSSRRGRRRLGKQKRMARLKRKKSREVPVPDNSDSGVEAGDEDADDSEEVQEPEHAAKPRKKSSRRGKRRLGKQKRMARLKRKKSREVPVPDNSDSGVEAGDEDADEERSRVLETQDARENRYSGSGRQSSPGQGPLKGSILYVAVPYSSPGGTQVGTPGNGSNPLQGRTPLPAAPQNSGAVLTPTTSPEYPVSFGSFQVPGGQSPPPPQLPTGLFPGQPQLPSETQMQTSPGLFPQAPPFQATGGALPNETQIVNPFVGPSPFQVTNGPMPGTIQQPVSQNTSNFGSFQFPPPFIPEPESSAQESDLQPSFDSTKRRKNFMQKARRSLKNLLRKNG